MSKSDTQHASFRFVDLFAGIGGFRLGFESLGAQCVFSSEWDKYACETYAANFGEKPAGDITEIAAEEVPAHDVLTAGFPCQPFSIAGVSKNNALGRAHGFEHEAQGTLFFDVCRIIAHHCPRAFLLENVRNLVSHDKGQTFRVIMRALEKDLGYHVHARILDAQSLVPQHRQRIYIVGFRDPLDFNFPLMPDLKPRLRDILEPSVPRRYTLSDHLWEYLQNYAAKHKAAGNGFGFGLPDFNGTTRTLSARYYKDGSEILISQYRRNPRRLTPRECARLMGYPDWFEIPVSDTRAYKQFGNSVVVPVVRLLAQEMLQCLHRQRGLSNGQLKLLTEQNTVKPKQSASTAQLFNLSGDGCENGDEKTRAVSRGVLLATSGTP